MVGLLSFLSLVSGIAFVGSLVALVVRVVRKQPRKPAAIVLGASAAVFLVSFVGVGVLYTPPEKPATEPLPAPSAAESLPPAVEQEPEGQPSEPEPVPAVPDQPPSVPEESPETAEPPVPVAPAIEPEPEEVPAPAENTDAPPPAQSTTAGEGETGQDGQPRTNSDEPPSVPEVPAPVSEPPAVPAEEPPVVEEEPPVEETAAPAADEPDTEMIRSLFDAMITEFDGGVISINPRTINGEVFSWAIIDVVVPDAWYALQEYQKERYCQNVGDYIRAAVIAGGVAENEAGVAVHFFDVAGAELASSKLFGGYKILK